MKLNFVLSFSSAVIFQESYNGKFTYRQLRAWRLLTIQRCLDENQKGAIAIDFVQR